MDTIRQRWLAALVCALSLAGAVWAAYAIAEQISIRSLRQATSYRMDIYVASLQAELNRFEYLPSVVALNEQVVGLLERPEDRAQQAHANRYLQTVNARAGASAIYVMDIKGLTLAASNWDQPASFVSMSFAYRPYFQEAIMGGQGRFYGIGTVSREPGFYFGHAIVKSGVTIGVAAVKVNLEKLDQAWRHVGEKIVVADANGVIFLSSEPNWKYRTLRQLSSETMSRLAATRQYTEAGLLSPLGLTERRVLDDATTIVQVNAEPIEHQSPGARTDYLVHGQGIPGTDWRLLVLSELSPVRNAGRISAVVAALACGLVALVFLFYQQRRRIVAQTIASRAALQRANDELERNVHQRTEALSDANRQLHGEVVERKRAEDALRATMEDLVHTAKMAVLGQMSAGVTHELNQPLAALRTLSANAIVFLERGQLDQAESNLRMIARLSDHMGKITAQLKKFARKSAPSLKAVAVSSAVSDALFLLGQSSHIGQVRVEQNIDPPDLMTLCDANRLEQVLLNLLSNAMDAVAQATAPKILIRARGGPYCVCIEVHDNGGGVPNDVVPHLFEPFFSTKEQGMGLGLGLAISADIARNLGGTLRAGESEVLGGALFTLQLKAVKLELAHA